MNQDATSDYRQTVKKTMQGVICKDIKEVVAPTVPQEPPTLIHLKVATISTVILQNKIHESGNRNNKAYQNSLEAK